MVNYYILGVVLLALVAGVVYTGGDIPGIGSSDGSSIDTGDGTSNPNPQIVLPQPQKATCATISCSSGNYCTLKAEVPYCVPTTSGTPAPPASSIEQNGRVIIQVLEWDWGQYGDRGRTNPTRRPGDTIRVYGYVQVPKSGTYVLETGFEGVGTLSFLFPSQSSKSACDNNPYYSGVKEYIRAGEKFYYEFAVKLPENPGFYSQYMGVFTGCFSEGGEWLESVNRQVRVAK